MGNGNVRGPRSCETNMYIMWVEGVWPLWRRGMLKGKVIIAVRMVAGRSQGCGSAGSEQRAR
jgi:hypothetical protein